MMPVLFRSVITLVIAVFTLAPAYAQEPKISKEWPDWLQKSMADEGKLRGKGKKIRLGDLRTRVLGKKVEIEPPSDENQFWSVSFDVGHEIPITCFVYTEELSIANAAAEISHNSMENLAEIYAIEIEVRALYDTDAGNFDSIPWVSLEWLYRLRADEPLVALTKTRVAELDSHTVACTHTAIGYRKTFARAFETMVTGLSGMEVESTPYFSDLGMIYINEKRIGFGRSRFFLDDDNDTKVIIDSSMLVAIDSGTLSATDTFDIAWSKPDGSLINGYTNSNTDGEIASELALDLSDGQWIVSGTLQGKEISAAVGGSDVYPVSPLGEIRRIRDIAVGEKGSATQYAAWVSNASPTELVAVSIRSGDHNTLKLQVGQLETEATVDSNGYVDETTTDLGNIKIQTKRTWMSGGLD